MTSEHNKAGKTVTGDNQRAVKTKDDPNFWSAIGVAIVFLMMLPAIFTLVYVMQPEPAPIAWETEAAALGITRMELASGAATFAGSCAVCHGADAEGVALLGKPLRNSPFVQAESDERLFKLIADGCAIGDPLNTTGALMPPRGAKGLSDERIHEVVAYLRAIQDPTQPPAAMDDWVLSDEERSSGAAIELTDHEGYEIYVASCAACHGQGGEGLEDLGLPLSTSGFVRGASDKDLITFIKTGRPMWDENNVTGLDMPPKGGNPAVTDEQLQLIVDYLRAVQAEATGG